MRSSSDARLKKNIKSLGQKWLDFFYKLKPRSFKYKNGKSGRTHTGFIAQEVEAAANECGIPTKDIAAIAIDESGQYYLVCVSLSVKLTCSGCDALKLFVRPIEAIRFERRCDDSHAPEAFHLRNI